MKKLMLATTVLVGTAGFAAADVTLSGDARLGITGGDNVDTSFSSRARVAFALSGESDSGLSFGASFRADNAAGAAAGDAGSVFVSGAFGKISMGDVDSADNIGQLSGVGYTGLGDSNELEYSADGVSIFGFAKEHGNVASAASKVLYTYSADAISISASASQTGDEQSYAVGATYSAGDLTVAAGYGVADVRVGERLLPNTPLLVGEDVVGDVKDTTLMAAYTIGATTLKAIYQHKALSATAFGEDLSGEADSYGMSVDHTIDALTLTGFAKTTKASDAISGGLTPSKDTDTLRMTSYGIGAAYDLGGGAKLVGGVARVQSIDWTIHQGVSADLAEDTVFDLGLTFSF